MSSYLYLILLAAFIACCSTQDVSYIPITDTNALSRISNEGGNTVISIISIAGTILKHEYKLALPGLESKHATCQNTCHNCTVDACTERAEGCRSSGSVGFDGIIGNGHINTVVVHWLNDGFVDFLTEDIPDFFTDDFVDTFTNFDGQVKDGFVDIGSSLNIVLNEVDNFFSTRDLEDVGAFLDGISDFFEGDFGDDFGSFIEGIFTRRRRRSTRVRKLVKRQTSDVSEPTCSELQADVTHCLYYTIDCPCSYFDECDGHIDSVDGLVGVIEEGRWLSLIATSTTYGYGVTAIYYSLAYIDDTNGQFNNTVASVCIFEYNFNVTIPEYVNVNNSTAYGPTIAKYAIDYFRDVYGYIDYLFDDASME